MVKKQIRGVAPADPKKAGKPAPCEKCGGTMITVGNGMKCSNCGETVGNIGHGLRRKTNDGPGLAGRGPGSLTFQKSRG